MSTKRTIKYASVDAFSIHLYECVAKGFAIDLRVGTFSNTVSLTEEEALELEKQIDGTKDVQGISFKLVNPQRVAIMRDDKKIGHIFSPGGSGERSLNVVQICGFSEAFDYWGCAVFEATKDIQLLFDGKKMEGKAKYTDGCVANAGCDKCFMEKCQCTSPSAANPFYVKREEDLKDRIEYEER